MTLLTFCTNEVLLRTMMAGDSTLSTVTHVMVVSLRYIIYVYQYLSELGSQLHNHSLDIKKMLMCIN